MGLYLVPASSENIKKTLLHDIDIATAEKFLVSSDLNKLKELLGTERRFNCWAMTEGTRSEFDKMQKGDTVLFAEKSTGSFKYKAEVFFTAESEEMGNYLWTYVPNKPWKLIYFVKDVKEVNIDKRTLVMALGYSPNYEVPGAIRVKEEYLHDIIDKYGSIQAFLDAHLKQGSKNELGNHAVKNEEADLKEKIDYVKQDYERPETFVKLIEEIGILRDDSEHKERAHESLVEHFYELLGFNKHTEIKYRQGRVDISISYQDKVIIVNEVKKDWHLTYKDKNSVKQGYSYAIENGARFVVITNGDYYAIFDRSKGLDMNSNLIGELRLTKLTKDCLSILGMLKKENLKNIL